MTDTWTWADMVAELHMSRLANVNFTRWATNEPTIDAWELADTRNHVNAVIEQAFELAESGNRTVFGEFEEIGP